MTEQLAPYSYAAEVKTPGDQDWVGNGLSFATESQAQQYVDDLAGRWFAVQETRVVEVDKCPTHIWLPLSREAVSR
jgi:hypothetical protein